MTAVARFARVSAAQYAADTAGFDHVMSREEIPLPRRATVGSAGYDFFCPVDVTVAPGQMWIVPSGIRALIEPGWVLVLCPRSSLGRKYRMRLANTVGIVDSDYAQAENEGHILLAVINGGDAPLTLRAGDRMCQGILLPFGLAEEEEVTGERRGGYGSTGQ